MRLNERHFVVLIDGVERVEFQCDMCGQGFYRYDKSGKHIGQHNQLSHVCSHCGHTAYFTVPYPALYYKGRVFVDLETIRRAFG